MKRLFAAVLSAVLILSLVGLCRSGGKQQPDQFQQHCGAEQ